MSCLLADDASMRECETKSQKNVKNWNHFCVSYMSAPKSGLNPHYKKFLDKNSAYEPKDIFFDSFELINST